VKAPFIKGGKGDLNNKKRTAASINSLAIRIYITCRPRLGQVIISIEFAPFNRMYRLTTLGSPNGV